MVQGLTGGNVALASSRVLLPHFHQGVHPDWLTIMRLGRDEGSAPEPGPVKAFRDRGPKGIFVGSASLPPQQADGPGWDGEWPLSPGKEQ